MGNVPCSPKAGDDIVGIRPSTPVTEYMKQFDLQHEQYFELMCVIEEQMEMGLKKSTNKQSSLKMLPTYLCSLPDGTEKGNFLALDLGGTNFRVLLVTLRANRAEMRNKIFQVPAEIMRSDGEKLFDYIVKCIAEFLKALNLDKQKLVLGFTFGFSARQNGLNSATLIQWAKGFQCAGVVGKDVVVMLQEAVHRRGDINVECVAILNDTVGCMMSCAFHDRHCLMGVILGAGTNACYMEHLERVETFEVPEGDCPSQVIVNTEWGALGDNMAVDFLRTKTDVDVDKQSVNPGFQTFEKMISGLYIGEIVRLCIYNMALKGHLFSGAVSQELISPNKFLTQYISEIEKDSPVMNYTNTRQIMSEMGYGKIRPQDCCNIQHICHLVGKRAAYLSATAIATVLNRLDRPNVTVAIDGSLYRFHPLFHTLLMEKIQELIKAGNHFRLMLSEDGSGKGAALVAAVAMRIKNDAGVVKTEAEIENHDTE